MASRYGANREKQGSRASREAGPATAGRHMGYRPYWSIAADIADAKVAGNETRNHLRPIFHMDFECGPPPFEFLDHRSAKSGGTARFAPNTFDALFLVSGNFAPQWLPDAEYQVCDRHDEYVLTDVSTQIEHAHDAALVAAIMDLCDPAPLQCAEVRHSIPQ